MVHKNNMRKSEKWSIEFPFFCSRSLVLLSKDLFCWCKQVQKTHLRAGSFRPAMKHGMHIDNHLWMKNNLDSTFDAKNFFASSTISSQVWPFTFQQPLQHAAQQPPQSLPESQSPSHHHQSHGSQALELLESNRLPEPHVNACYEHRDATCVPTNHYNVHFYSTFSNASSNSSFEHEKYPPKNGIGNQNSSNLGSEHG